MKTTLKATYIQALFTFLFIAFGAFPSVCSVFTSMLISIVCRDQCRIKCGPLFIGQEMPVDTPSAMYRAPHTTCNVLTGLALHICC